MLGKLFVGLAGLLVVLAAGYFYWQNLDKPRTSGGNSCLTGCCSMPKSTPSASAKSSCCSGCAEEETAQPELLTVMPRVLNVN
ncbi:MAG: hypothetical protein K8T89_17915 [Planctomycetes bacterium]|nr:hypothetical protein [Planctomycetota bacterium]